MIIDTEKDRLDITLRLDDVFELLRGGTLSEEGWRHLAGVLGEWYKDTWHERYERVATKKARLDSYSQEQKHVLKEYRILTAFECGCSKCVIPDLDPLPPQPSNQEIKWEIREIDESTQRNKEEKQNEEKK